MKKLLNIIYSTKATLWFLLIMAVAMATATFVEDKYDTETAYKYIYGAKWFELIMLLLVMNFIGNIHRYNLLSKKKIAGFLFHAAFIVIIIGAGVTRYFGFEGLMHITEGQSSNTIVIPKNVLKIIYIDKGEEKRLDVPIDYRDTAKLGFYRLIETKDGDDLKISYKKLIPNPILGLVENMEGGVDAIKLNVFDNGKEADVYIANKEVTSSTSYILSFNNELGVADVKVIERDGKYFVHAAMPLRAVTMPNMVESILDVDSLVELNPLVQFSTIDNAFKFIFHGAYKKAKQQIVSGLPTENSTNALLVNVNFKNKDYEVPLFINADGIAAYQNAKIDGISLLIGYGEKEIKLPFFVQLNDFILERYPGSSNPSSYASEVTVNDKRQGSPFNFKIYMNHILDHDGYRFFQSSYDRDEKGTVISVNHDFWGTWITYLGYFLLTLGFILTLFNKNSRFQILGKSIREIRKNRNHHIVILLFIFGFSSSIYSQELVLKPVDKLHAENLGQLITQTFDGRSEPVHTLAYDVMHKISRKDKFDFAGKGEMDAMQVFLDMIINPQFWKNQKIIYIKETAIAKLLGVQGKYAAYSDLVDLNGSPELKQQTEDAFIKKPQDQNVFDKEVIKVSERLEIFMMLSQGTLLKIFPEPIANSTVWISWENPQAQVLIEDNLNFAAEFKIPQFNYNNIMGAYLNAVYNATTSGNYVMADKVINYIENIQRHSAIAHLIPTKQQVDFEIYYNKANI
ncbi:MAG: cytochrome c biogenesis protein ResB, partial [Bacteroidia bacterium]|nr:cytochrome c biogenesis protein ResB [Bacteroidia bacterium]